ncbi:MAG: hypothetical protein HFH33_08830 [Eubacterium sp.]|nr:hypothetical protein [Eubacterium sp.]
MAKIRIKVSPGQLRQQAEQISQQIANAQKSFQHLCDTAGAAKHYWEGDAADVAGRLFQETKQQADASFRRMKEHPFRLLQMAGIYSEAEQQAAELSNSLPEDAIV